SGIRHVFGHLLLTVAELVMEAENRDAPAVLLLRIQVHVVFVARQHFAKAAHVNERTRVLPDLFFVLGAETWSGVSISREHPKPAPPFKSVTPKELGMALFEISEPGKVEAARPAVVESARLAGQVLHETGHARTHDVLAKVVAYVAAGISDAVRIKARFGEQHEPRRFERRSGQDDDLGHRLVSLEGFRVDE